MAFKFYESGSDSFIKSPLSTNIITRSFVEDEDTRKFLGLVMDPRLQMIENYLDRFNTVSVQEVDYTDIEGLSTESLPLNINSYLDFIPITVDKVETGFDNLGQLAIYFAEASIRKALESIISDAEFLESLISKVLNAGNRNVRLGSALVEFRSIFDAVLDSKDRLVTPELRQIMLFLLRAAFKKWNLLYQDKAVVRFNLRKREQVSSTLLTELNLAFAERALNDLSFEPINDDNKGYTTAGILATSFQNSLERLRHAMIAMTQNDLALNCLLPRIRSFILHDMANYTKEQMVSFTNATFLNLASNATLVMLALKDDVPTTTTIPELYWNNYDELLLSVLQTSPSIRWSSLSRIVNKFSANVVRDFKNTRKAVVLSRNIRSNDSLSSYYRMKSGSFDEFVSFNSLDKITSIMNTWSNGITSYTINEMATSILSSFVNTEDNEKICLIGCHVDDGSDDLTDMELQLLAMSLADSVRVRKSDKGLARIEYLIDVYKSVDSALEFRNVPRQIVSTNVQTILFCKLKEFKGDDFEIADLKLELMPGKKYHQSSFIIQSNFSKEIPLRLSYAKRESTNEILRFTDLVSFSTLFQLDVPQFIAQERPFVGNLIIGLLLKSRDVIYDHLIAQGVNSDQEFLLSTKVSRTFGKLWGSLIDHNDIRAIADHVLGIYENNFKRDPSTIKLFDGGTSTWKNAKSNVLFRESTGWRYNITIKDKISFDIIWYLMQVYGFITIEQALAYGDDMSILISYYIMDKHML